MWVRNVVCSVVTLALVWALAHYWREFGRNLTAGDDLGGLAVFGALSILVIFCIYLIAKAVDARAERRPGRQD